MRRSHKVGIIIIGLLVIALVATRVDIPMGKLPTPGNINEAEEKAEQLQRQVRITKKKQEQYRQKRSRLKQQADMFWKAREKNPKVEVQNKFEELAGRARVTLDRVGGVQMSEVSDNIRVVRFSVRLDGSMQDFSKLLAQIDQSAFNFYWDRCRIRPDDPENPRNVRINGSVKAFVLTPEATRFIFDNKEDTAS